VVVRSNAKLAYWTAFVLLLSALQYATRYAGNATTSQDYLYTWGAAIGGVIQFGIVVGLMLLIARGLPTWEAFALRRPTSWGTAAGLDVGVLIGVFVLGAALSPLVQPGQEQGLIPERWEPSRAAPFVANAIVVIVLAPIAEELAFRGLGFTLLDRFGDWAAIVLVGLAFALVHGLLEAFPLLFAFGAGLAFIRARTGSIYPTILLHATFNAIALISGVAF
jgi:membrane protease YdiL (CAAX protease family)